MACDTDVDISIEMSPSYQRCKSSFDDDSTEVCRAYSYSK